MTGNLTRNHLLEFLDFVADKGLVPKATAQARKAAVTAVFEIISEDEANDITLLDIDDVIRRFQNKFPNRYNPDSLQTYRSRIRTAIDDFRSYRENPLGFRPLKRFKLLTRPQKQATVARSNSNAGPDEVEAKPVSGISSVQPSILPIPLRANLTVQVAGLPFDLTQAEARKISNVIIAYAVVD